MSAVATHPAGNSGNSGTSGTSESLGETRNPRRVSSRATQALEWRGGTAALLLLISFLFTTAPSLMAEEPALTRRERKDLLAKLPEKHRQFLMDVAPIIIPTERDTFLRMETEAQREIFIDDFWRRRDQARGTTNQSARDEYYAHLDFVKDNFGSAGSDRGRIYLIQGPPARITDINCSRYYVPIQVWHYERIPELGSDFRVLFFIPRFEKDYRLWQPMGDLQRAMGELISKEIDATGGPPNNPYYDCAKGEELSLALAMMKASALRLNKLYEPPAVNEEDVNRILRSVVRATPGAKKLEASIGGVDYLYAPGNRTDARLTIHVPRAQLQTTSAGETTAYTLDVVGEVLRDDKLWERYRYRFDYPGDVKDDKLPVVIDRLLRPASYLSRVKISDAATGAEVLLETTLTVPEIAATVSAESATLSTIANDLQSTRATLRIVPLEEGVTSGVETIQTIVTGSGIKAVEFWLDGKRVATRRSPPYTLDLDFGTVPRLRRIRVVALDSHGEPITGDEIVVNTGTDPFRVRIASPRIAPKLTGLTRVEVDVRVPEGKELANVELFWNETRVATMFGAPFVHTVNIPATDGVGYLRAVATLAGGELDPVEDVVMVNTPDYMETIDVHLVELPTTVLRDGKPVLGLGQEAFRVTDEGEPVTLAKFEYVKDLPLSIGMAVDMSGSMTDRLEITRRTGAAFFRNVMRKGDKAFLVAFDAQPHMMQKWSDDVTDLQGGLARMRAEESTAFYDAIVYSLYNFLGVKGQKALVLLTDGKDTASKFTYEQSLEYAQRAAVPVYVIGLGIRSVELDVRSKINRLATETGGTSYYIDDVADLQRIYTDIENELRSQYVLGFYPGAGAKAGGKWRSVDVEVKDAKVKTLRGYYP
jgi:Ca-activated chloride channel homolog